ncbi:MAG: TonB-dependent receptor [Microscillaceae bacterium]|jgi:iron complex outermembrane receptor protein|nr:TonB-dependent receptor [Microscillaceae bacterium]
MMTNNYLANFINSSQNQGEELINGATQPKLPNQIKTWLLTLLVSVFSFGWAFAQERTITGVVKDNTGFGLPGVSVYVKGTTKGTITDGEGKYTLSGVPEGATLTIQAVGYLSQDIAVGAGSTLDIELAEDVTRLNEVVVVGYGTQLKKDVTGSVTALTTKDFNPGPITNPLQQLNGRAAGVNINQVGNEPGVTPNIRIRGVTSLISDGANDPLVVVDGVQGNLGLLNQIPPSEIESIDILKDASATAIYGSRGASGVILVTTKRGQEGSTSIEYSGVFSVETIAKSLDVMNADQYRSAAQSLGITDFDRGGNTNWLDQVSRTGNTQTHNLAFGGGNKNFNYRASGTAILQKGIIENSGSENFIGRVQATQRGFNDKLTLTYNLNLATLDRDFNGPGAIGGVFSTRPTNPVFAQDGSYDFDNTLFSYTNPVARVREIIDTDKTNSLFGSMKLDYEVIDGLTATVFGSWRLTDRTYKNYESRIATFGGRSNNGIGIRETNRSDERLFNFILNYRKVFGKHSLDAIFVNEWQKGVFEGNRIRGIGFPNDILGADAIQNAELYPSDPNDPNPRSYKNDRTLSSFLGRVNYSFDDKYLLTASFRRDGSSVFGANNRWANFISASAAWRISQESFMKNQKIFQDLKIRVGFGITGNQNGLDPLGSVLRSAATGQTFFGGNLINNYSITQNANPDLKWETRQMFNAGIDFTMLNNKLSGTIDGFYGTTTDLLFEFRGLPVPPFLVDRIRANVGEIVNQGLELSLNYRLLDTKDLTVSLGGNFTTIRTRVTSLQGTLPSYNDYALDDDNIAWGGEDIIGVGGQNNDMSYLIVGQSLGTFYLFKHAGIDDNGRQIIVDLNGNGRIDQGRESGDRYIAGQALPKFTYAFTPSIRYKNFDLNMVIRGAYGHKVYNVQRARLSLLNRVGQSNVMSDALSIGMRNVADESASDFWLEDGGFTRLENLTIGYNMNTANMGVIKNLRLSFTTNNLFVISGYRGIDPEIRNNGGNGAGLDTGIYPRTRNFAVGLNVTFK